MSSCPLSLSLVSIYFVLSCSVVSDSLGPHGLYCSPWNSPGQNTGVGSLSLLQGIFPTQGSNPGVPHCRHILYQLSHRRSPRTLKWVAYPFSRGSCQPKNRIGVSRIAGGFCVKPFLKCPLPLRAPSTACITFRGVAQQQQGFHLPG